MVSNPQSTGFVLLLPALPGLWLAANRLTGPGLRGRDAYVPVTTMVALALWLVGTTASARVFGSFDRGLWIATTALAIGGYLMVWRSPLVCARRRPPASAWMWPTAVLSSLPIAIMAFGGGFFDEDFPNGHRGIIAQLQNGEYPPRNTLFPEYPLRYHYGFNVVCAGMTAMTRMSVSNAMDTVVVVCWALSWCLLWVLGDRLAWRGAGKWTALATLWGSGGMAVMAWYLVSSSDRPISALLVGKHMSVADLAINPCVLAYFFQKPFALGIPLALAVLYVSADHRLEWRHYRGLVLCVLLAALSVAHAVLFVVILPSLAVSEVFGARRWGVLWTVAGSLLLAAVMGGMLFTGLPEGASIGLETRVWPLKNGFFSVLTWHAVTFGALLPLGFAGFFFLRRQRLLFALLTAGCLIVPNLVRYQHTWDIVKFSHDRGSGAWNPLGGRVVSDGADVLVGSPGRPPGHRGSIERK